MAAAHHHRVLVKQIHQPGEGKKRAFFLIWFQPAVQLQDGLQRADGQDVAAFSHIGFHTRKDTQPISQFQCVPNPPADRGEVAIQLGKLQGVEMLCQA